MSSQLSIPAILFQTSPDRPPDYVIKMLETRAKGFEYLYFNDDDILRFFRENPLPGFEDVSEVFHSFSNGAHKADLFRYYFLYLNGGVYIDTDAMIEADIQDIIGNYEFVSVKSYHADRDLLFNGFIATRPGHPILRQALEDIYHLKDDHLQEDYYKVCADFYDITVSHTTDPGVYLYQEQKLPGFYAATKVVDEKSRDLLCHYEQPKKIPNPDHWSYSLLTKFIFRNKYLFKMYRALNK